MKQWLDYYSTNPAADKIRSVQAGLDSVKEVMVENIQSLIKRGDKIENVLAKTDQLVEDSGSFKQGATGLKRHMYFKNMKLMIVILIVILCAILTGAVLVILVLVILVCGYGGICTSFLPSTSSA